MVIVDTSAWIEYFHDGLAAVVNKVDLCLEQELVAIGDLIYCEVMQGLRSPRERREVSDLLLSIPRIDMFGFRMAEKSEANYRLLLTKGISVRKTIDVLISKFGVEHGMQLIHHDSDFDLMANHIGLDII